ncbi:UNVERIFIED_CONTAM: hypothetical protein RMT77_007050 [Armadillidium vulgare]
MKTELKPNTYWLTRILFLRALSFIFFVAFLVAYNQNKELIGDGGLLPLKLYMKILKSHTGDSWWEKIKIAPTLFWLKEPWTDVNLWLDSIALAGATLSALIFISGSSNIIFLFILWILYHSLVNVGQRWYSFGWESQLLETCFIGLWGVPFLNLSSLPKNSPMSWVSVWGLRWLIVRIMLGAGLIKLRGDRCWRDLTCMDYHYETQPVPNPLSYYLHQSPSWIHKGETFGNHIVECVIPFFAFLPRIFQIWCGIIQILFQVILIISGNLSFLNWLTIVPSIAFFDDKCLAFLFSRKMRSKVSLLQISGGTEGGMRKLVNLIVGVTIGVLSLPIVFNLLSSQQIMNTSFDPFRIVNTYGAFGSVTKTRHEVIFKGTHSEELMFPNATWLEYEFKCKPGNLKRRPCLISPYHYRLDWLMWFAAFQRYEQNPWLVHLAGRLLRNDDEISGLIEYNPFLDENRKPPLYIKADLYLYNYAPIGSAEAARGQWYKRKYVRNYLPPVNLKLLKSVFREMGWQRTR